ncbi:MAG: radical SAM protein [Bacteroidota bacterium]|nr:radical SAM protein [Bacteroidota bacterium]MDP4191987.1 radical SAM protein [Bacteroidota bacterium]MDP4197149.1 radical SAM protein [Bacteroidota bacterium]
MNFEPSYLKLFKSGELKERAIEAEKNLSNCTSCPRNCQIDRKSGKLGSCLSGYFPIVSSYTAHFGEEPALSGTKGAGNIFFGNCNLKCVFCQNFEISQNWKSEMLHEVSFERLADIMIELQNKGCHNIGLVSPTHFSPQILISIYIAAEKGLRLPIIYNTNGYDSVEMLRLYQDVIDIYLPDFKYGDNYSGKTYSKVENYFDNASLAISEMYRQVGNSYVFDNNVLLRGLIIRHLVLPNGLSESEEVFRFISEKLSPELFISLMSQYYPTNKAQKDILISRPIRLSEYEKAIYLLEKYNLKNGWIQEMESSEYYRPEFMKDRDKPFTE